MLKSIVGNGWGMPFLIFANRSNFGCFKNLAVCFELKELIQNKPNT